MDKHQDAYKFLKRSLKKYFQKYLFHNPNLTNEQKSAMFERIFLVTKLRPLTQSEKELVDNLIAKKGLFLPLSSIASTGTSPNFTGTILISASIPRENIIPTNSTAK
jgi:hypothetical protein